MTPQSIPKRRGLVSLFLLSLWAWRSPAAPLPVPSDLFVSSGSGRASAPVVTGRTMNIRQHTPKVTLNWDSFDIAAGHTVNFQQPSSSATALNLIHDANPSLIQGRLRANGEVWLLNQNGIVFGRGAEVNVRGLLASTLSPTADALSTGLAPQSAQAYIGPALSGAATGEVRLAPGASITTNGESGRVFLFAPTVTNQGSITAADGQVALAAGTEIFIRQPEEGAGSGLIVEVGHGGIVTNGANGNAGQRDPAALLGQVVADRGTATLVGLSVNQLGRVSASSAVRAGGTVRLLARSSVQGSAPGETLPSAGGQVLLGQRSVTSVNPDAGDDALAVDASTPQKGRLEAVGKQVTLAANSLVQAHGGAVRMSVNDQGNELLDLVDAGASSQSRITMANGSRIDVSGATASANPDRNLLTIKLQGSELKDRPVQRESALRGQTITVDLRKSGTLADGTPWVGTPLADLRSAAAADLKRSNAERNSLGGTVSLRAQGSVLLSRGSSIDVSGGQVDYAASNTVTSMLFGNGRVVDIADADPNMRYDGVYGDFSVVHQKWGPTDAWSVFERGGTGSNSPAYVEGKDAGTLSIAAPSLVLDGDVQGRAVAGLYQRKPTDYSSARDDDTERLARPFDQRPRRGTLELGQAIPRDSLRLPEYLTPDVRIAADTGPLMPTGFDPAVDALLAPLMQVRVATDWFGAEGLGALTIYAEGDVTLPQTSVLDLGPGGRLKLEAGGIRHAGTVLAPAGNVDYLALTTADRAGVTPSSGEVVLGSRALVDVSGLWTNDLPTKNSTPPGGDAPLLSNAGAIKLAAEAKSNQLGGLTLSPGMQLRADSGGAISASGKLSGGVGGTITLSSRPFAFNDPDGTATGFDLAGLAGGVSAYGIKTGGKLQIEVPSICISAACGTPQARRLDLAPTLFTQGGFQRFELTARGGALSVLEETRVDLQQQNLLPGADFLDYASGSDVRDFSSVGLLPAHQRGAADLVLNVRAINDAGAFTPDLLAAAGALEVGTGAQIAGEPGARLSLNSDTRLWVNGGLSAPGGSIDLTLTGEIKGSKLVSFLDAQTLWLGPQASLSVPAVFTPEPGPSGLLAGRLLNGGSIKVSAQSGYLIAEAGSLLDVHAVSSLLDILPGGALPSARERRLVGSNAGSITLQAAEGLLFDGELIGTSAAAGGRAGSLTLSMDALSRGDDPGRSTATLNLPIGPRVLSVARLNAPAVPQDLRPGMAVPGALNGLGLIDEATLESGDFGDITLISRNYVRAVLGVPGVIRLGDGVALEAPRRLSLLASSIEGVNGTARIAAPYLALGNPDNFTSPSQVLGTLSTGTARLAARADFIDFIGHWQLNKWAGAAFNSAGDLRLRGVQVINEPQLATFGSGSLSSHGDLTFTAAQTYPATLSHYALNVTGNPAGRLSFLPGAETSASVLSVGGELTLNAPYIHQAGVLRAPLGLLDLNAGKRLDLMPGSLSSTSLTDATALFGRIELGKDWIYQLDSATTPFPRLVFSPQSSRDADVFPAGRVRLSGESVNFRAGAVIDQRGSGDLMAYEFEPGLKGSSDPLNTTSSFAILPALGSAYAPFDPQEQAGFGLQPGETITLDAAAGDLPAGRYALLPAHFALLPGAYLVTPQSAYTDLATGTALSLTGQGVVVSGRRGSALGLEDDARTGGFLIRDADALAALGSFSRHFASSFEGLGDQTRPQDAGTLQMTPTESLRLGGRFLATPGRDGRGARAEIAGINLAVVPSLATATRTPGTLLLDADELSALKAPTLILGGTTEGGRDERQLTVSATRIDVRSGATLRGSDLILAATDTISVARGATLAGTLGGTTSQGVLTVGQLETLDADGNQIAPPVAGDGALLRVSSGAPIGFQRLSETALSGRLELAAGSTLSATGATLLDASLDTLLDGTLNLRGTLTLGASRINLGTPGGAVDGLVLPLTRLQSLGLDELALSARRGIDVYGAVNLRVDALSLDTPGLYGYENAGKRAALSADVLRLANTSGGDYLAPGAAVAGNGTLLLAGGEASVAGEGSSFHIGGFGNTQLQAARTLSGVGDSTLAVDGDLTIATGRIAPEGAAKLTLEASGALAVTRPARRPALAVLDAIGASLSLRGASIDIGSELATPAGRITLTATGTGGDVRLLNGARLDASGRSLAFGSTLAAAPGGSIELSAEQGDIRAFQGAEVDLSGGLAGGDAGTLALLAGQGQVTFPVSGVRAAAVAGARQGQLRLDVATLSAPDALGDLLESFSAEGFTERLQARVRHGAVDIAAGTVLKAHGIEISADDGSLNLAGLLDARGSEGGRVRLAAADEITLAASARVLANATARDGRGGVVELQSASASDGMVATGGIALAAGSQINTAAGSDGLDGRLHLRLPEASALSVLDGDPSNDRLLLAGTLTGAGAQVLEGFRAYTDNSLTAADVLAAPANARYAAALAFVGQTGALETALGANAQTSNFHIRPGLEIRSPSDDLSSSASDLTLNAIWDLSAWRFSGEPGVLTLRAAGNLRFNDILSDGFSGTLDLARAASGVSQRCSNPLSCAVRPTVLPTLLGDESWSYRLVAGADLTAADGRATVAAPLIRAAGREVGNLSLAGGTVSVPRVSTTAPLVQRPVLNAIRTGTGQIELAAAGDVTLENRAAVIYTAGKDTGEGILLGSPALTGGRATLQQKPYPTLGGDVWIGAGASINGVDPTLDFTAFDFDVTPFPKQMVSSWLLRQGDVARFDLATGWTVGFEWFEQGVGALGGGLLDVTAGKDFNDLSLSVAASGRQIGGTTASTSRVEVVGGGRLNALAVGDIKGGVFYVGKGAGAIYAGGDVTYARNITADSDTPLLPLLAEGDASLSLTAGGALTLAGVINPTFVAQGPVQKNEGVNQTRNSHFITYGAASAVQLTARNGDLRLQDASVIRQGGFENRFGLEADDLTLRLYPPLFGATAFRGSLTVDAAFTLAPSPTGNISLLAGDSVFLQQAVNLSDTTAASLPTVENPRSLASDGVSTEVAQLQQQISPTTPSAALAPVPVHLGHDATPARVIARRGDVTSGDDVQLFLSRPAEIFAGRDVFNLNLVIEHTDAADVSSIQAGRDMVYLTPRLPTDTALGAAGSLNATQNSVAVWGPGRLLVTTGAALDLGTAGGVVSRGDEINAALSGEGASVSVFAGLGSEGLDLDGFMTRYFASGSEYLSALRFDGERGAAALAKLRAASAGAQLGPVLDAFFTELQLTGRAAAKTLTPDYTRGDTALKTLLPGEDYAGDLNLYFSRIFTTRGGNIDLLAPGGSINVGLATPPSSFGISKAAGELGIVTEGTGDVRVYLKDDMDVNESRVFAADGGDIVVWSNFGDIDAGRGARSAISVPGNGFQFDNDGKLTVSVPAPIQGSGIRALTTTPGRAFGNVDLVTPRGVVNASEAGIESAGNITIAAVEVLGSENIKAGGDSVGVPVSSVGTVGASVGGAAGAANAASKAATQDAAGGERAPPSAGMAAPSMSIISVEFLGFGA